MPTFSNPSFDMTSVRWILLTFSLMTLTSPAASYTSRTYSDPTGSIRYQLLVPPGYDATKKYPVLIFFHGIGERGTDGASQLKWVAPVFAGADFQAKNPCFVVVPQCPPPQPGAGNAADNLWVDTDYFTPQNRPRSAEPTKPMTLALKALDQVEAKYSIDKNRVYVAGLSMGGFATWDCITRFPNRFAAAIACCGGGDDTTVTAEVARVPMWAFHSADDPVVHVQRTRMMIDAMKKAGGDPKYTEFTGLGHASWTKAFSTDGLYDWLFSQNLAQRPPAP
jgi:predicted peptidase